MAEHALDVEEMRKIFSAADCPGIVALIGYLLFEKAEGVVTTQKVGFNCDPRPVAKRGPVRYVRPGDHYFSLGGRHQTPLEALVEIAACVPDINLNDLKEFNRECAILAEAMAYADPNAGHG